MTQMIDLLLRNFMRTSNFINELNMKNKTFDDKEPDVLLSFLYEIMKEFYILIEIIKDAKDDSTFDDLWIKMNNVYEVISSTKRLLIDTFKANNRASGNKEKHFTLLEKILKAEDSHKHNYPDIPNSDVTCDNIGFLQKLLKEKTADHDGAQLNNYYAMNNDYKYFQLRAEPYHDLVNKAEIIKKFGTSIWEHNDTATSKCTEEEWACEYLEWNHVIDQLPTKQLETKQMRYNSKISDNNQMERNVKTVIEKATKNKKTKQKKNKKVNSKMANTAGTASKIRKVKEADNSRKAEEFVTREEEIGKMSATLVEETIPPWDLQDTEQLQINKNLLNETDKNVLRSYDAIDGYNEEYAHKSINEQLEIYFDIDNNNKNIQNFNTFTGRNHFAVYKELCCDDTNELENYEINSKEEHFNNNKKEPENCDIDSEKDKFKNNTTEPENYEIDSEENAPENQTKETGNDEIESEEEESENSTTEPGNDEIESEEEESENSTTEPGNDQMDAEEEESENNTIEPGSDEMDSEEEESDNIKEPENYDIDSDDEKSENNTTEPGNDEMDSEEDESENNTTEPGNYDMNSEEEEFENNTKEPDNYKVDTEYVSDNNTKKSEHNEIDTELQLTDNNTKIIKNEEVIKPQYLFEKVTNQSKNNLLNAELNPFSNDSKNCGVYSKQVVLTRLMKLCYPHGMLEVVGDYVITELVLPDHDYIIHVAYTINAWNTIITLVFDKKTYYCCCCGLTILGNDKLKEHLADGYHYNELKYCIEEAITDFFRTGKSEQIHCSICDVMYHENQFYERHADNLHADKLIKAIRLACDIKAGKN